MTFEAKKREAEAFKLEAIGHRAKAKDAQLKADAIEAELAKMPHCELGEVTTRFGNQEVRFADRDGDMVAIRQYNPSNPRLVFDPEADTLTGPCIDLNREQVSNLSTVLQRWLSTGKFHREPKA